MNNKSICLSLLLGLMLGACSVFAASLKTYEAAVLAQAPLIDGEIDSDPAWKDAKYVSQMSLWSDNAIGEKPKADRQTFFKLGYTGKALFIAIKCNEPNVADLVVSGSGGKLWLEDSVEVFLKTEMGDDYFHFIANAQANKIAAMGKAIPKDQGWNWKAVAKKNKDCFSVELEIPWPLLMDIPAEGSQWGLNICRNVRSGGANLSQTWANVENTFHDPNNFGQLLLTEDISMEDMMANQETMEQVDDSLFVYSKPTAGIYIGRGKDVSRIAYYNGGHVNPQISYDEQKVLFHSLKNGKSWVSVCDVDGKNPKQIHQAAQSRWSFDGSKIVSNIDGKIVEIILSDNSQKTIDTNGLTNCKLPGYMPDGKVFFVATDSKNTEGLYVEGDSEPLITGDIYSPASASYDQAKIAVSIGGHIYLVDVATKKAGLLTLAGGVQTWPTWAKDNQSLCYAQSATLLDGPRDIYNVEIENPTQVSLVTREVDTGFDFHGVKFAQWSQKAVKGANFDVQKSSATAKITTDWFVLNIDSEIKLTSGKETMTIVLKPKDGSAAGNVKSVKVTEKNKYNAQIEVTFDDPKKYATVFLSAGSPVVTIKASKAIAKIAIEGKLSAVIVPDRLASDMIITADSNKPKNMPLGKVAFVAAGTKETGQMVVVAGDNAKVQDVAVRQGAATLEAIEICACDKVHLTILPTEKAFVVKKPEGDKVLWSKPFHANWRLVASGDGYQAYSELWNEDAVGQLKKPELSIKDFNGKAKLAVVYAYERDWHSPLDFYSVGDVLRDCLGVDKAYKRLSVKEARNYRTCRRRTMQPEIEPLLDFMLKVRTPGYKRVRPMLNNFASDVIALIGGMEKRIGQCRRFEKAIKHLAAKINKSQIDSIVEKHMKKISEIATENWAKDIVELRAGLKTIGEKRKAREFIEKAKNIADKRKEIITQYRQLAKDLRQAAVVSLADGSMDANDVAKIKAITDKILSYRYYMEGDWRGELPLKNKKEM